MKAIDADTWYDEVAVVQFEVSALQPGLFIICVSVLLCLSRFFYALLGWVYPDLKSDR